MTRAPRRCVFMHATVAMAAAAPAHAQTALTWPDVRSRFEAPNPSLQADRSASTKPGPPIARCRDAD